MNLRTRWRLAMTCVLVWTTAWAWALAAPELPQGTALPCDAPGTSTNLAAGPSDRVAAVPAGSPTHLAGMTGGTARRFDLGNGIDLDMVWVPPGTFTMGSPRGEAGRDMDEVQHEVRLTKGFWLGTYEVTQAQWAHVMKSNAGPTEASGGRAPVQQVSWEDCQEFIRRLNEVAPGGQFRLPTEAEWEYACRAGTQTAFACGKDLAAGMANFNVNYPRGNEGDGDPGRKTLPVGSFKPNAWGLHDMHGNVWEWCADWYGAYPNGTVADPTGPSSGDGRVRRGGGWNSGDRGCRSARRNGYDPGSRKGFLGLRVAADWLPSTQTESP